MYIYIYMCIYIYIYIYVNFANVLSSIRLCISEGSLDAAASFEHTWLKSTGVAGKNGGRDAICVRALSGGTICLTR